LTMNDPNPIESLANVAMPGGLSGAVGTLDSEIAKYANLLASSNLSSPKRFNAARIIARYGRLVSEVENLIEWVQGCSGSVIEENAGGKD
jgi:hypothetical protein